MVKICLSCGCGIPYDSHNDERNITLTDLRDAMYAGGLSSPKDVIKNIKKTWKAYNNGDIDNLFGDPKSKDDDDDDDSTNYGGY